MIIYENNFVVEEGCVKRKKYFRMSNMPGLLVFHVSSNWDYWLTWIYTKKKKNHQFSEQILTFKKYVHVPLLFTESCCLVFSPPLPQVKTLASNSNSTPELHGFLAQFTTNPYNASLEFQGFYTLIYVFNKHQ